jgi:hypothetical protein
LKNPLCAKFRNAPPFVHFDRMLGIIGDNHFRGDAMLSATQLSGDIVRSEETSGSTEAPLFSASSMPVASAANTASSSSSSDFMTPPVRRVAVASSGSGTSSSSIRGSRSSSASNPGDAYKTEISVLSSSVASIAQVCN